MLNRDNPDDIRTLIDVVKRVKGLKGGAGILVANGPGGIVISLAPVREYRPETSATVASGSVSFLVTSDASPGSTYRRYNAKSYTGGTLSGSEDIIVENGAEPVSLFSSNMLLVSPNTTAFGVEGAGVKLSVDSGTGKNIIVAWIGFAGCSSATPSSPIVGGTP